MNIKSRLQLALSLCHQNNFQQAKKIYIELINIIPNSSEILTNLGVIELNEGNIQQGIDLISKSLKIKPNQANAITNLATAFLEINKIQEAINEFEKGIILNKENFNFFYNYARALRLSNRLEEAVENYDKAILLNPAHYLAFNNRGFIFFQKKQYDHALNDFTESLKINPNYAEAYLNRGNVLLKKKLYARAVHDFECAVRLNPALHEAFLRNAQALIKIREYRSAISNLDLYLTKEEETSEVLLNLGIAYYGLKEYQKSLSFLEMILSNNQLSFQALITKGFIYFEQRKYKEAENIFELTKKIKPQNSSGYIGLARIYIELDKFNLANIELKLAIQNCSNILEAEYNLSMLYLNQKNFYEGWRLYEKRFETETYSGDYLLKNKTQEVHDLNFQDKKVLIYNEQGIGDQVLFMSLISELNTENNSFDVIVDSRLISLCKRSLPNLKFIAKNERFCEDHYDYVLMSASLGKYLRTSTLDFSKHPVGYLVSNKNEVNKFRERFSKKGKFVCGISWKSSNENIGNDKSFDLLKLLPILRMKDIFFVNLQYGEVDKEIESISKEYRAQIDLASEIDKFNNIDGLASLIEACDFVITASNVTAHLSGALNKKTFLLLPHSRGRLWYWHQGDETSLWYPLVMQFPQREKENWDETILRLQSKIKGYLNEQIS